MRLPNPDSNEGKHRWWSRSSSRARKLVVWTAVGGLIVVVCSHTRGESDANLANGYLRFKEYRAFILTRSDERATELSNLAHAAGYQPQSDIWVHCKFHYDYGPYKVLGNGWDMEAYSLIINAGAIASHAKDLEYRKLVFELEETMKTLHP